MNLSQVQFLVAAGPYKHSDGAYAFKLLVLNTSPIQGGVSEPIAVADVWVKGDKSCFSLGEALKQVAGQLPPDLVGMDN